MKIKRRFGLTAWVAGLMLTSLGCTPPTPRASTNRDSTTTKSTRPPPVRRARDLVEVHYAGTNDAVSHITSFLKIYFPDVKRQGNDWVAIIHTLPPSGMGHAGNNAVNLTSKTARVRYNAAKKTVRFQVRETQGAAVLTQAQHDTIVNRHQRFWRTYGKMSADFLAREFAPLNQ